MNDPANNAYESIFRKSAIQRHIKDREEAALPQFVSPRSIFFLWVLLGLLIVGVFLAWLGRIPIYISGIGVVKEDEHARSDQSELVVISLLPPDSHSHLQTGQPVFIRNEAAEDGRIQKSITTVEPGIMGPQAIQKQFGLHDAAMKITKPAAIAKIKLTPFSSSLPASAYPGSIYEVDVEIGSRRVISMLPIIGMLFQDSP